MGGAKRHLAIALPWLVIAVILQAILVQQFIAAQGDISKVSVGVRHSLDHSYFVGLMTNMLFGSILVFLGARMAQWPWADNVIFWGMNVGWIGFAASELLGSIGLVPIFTPIMGLSLLLGVATYAMRLRGVDAPAAVTAPAVGGA